MTFEQLITSCQSVERKGQNLLFERYYRFVAATVWRYISVPAVTEEICSNTFLKIFDNIPKASFPEERMLIAWMRKIAVNECLMHLRKANNFKYMETIEEHIDMNVVENEGWHELAFQDLMNVIVQLPEGYRTVFNLSVLEGYSHQEIAQELTITESTARSQLFKAKRHLKALLNN